jgi:hypothetical protein
MVATRLAPCADRQSASQSASLFNPDRARGEGRSYGVARLSVRATAGRRSEGGSPRAAEAWRGRSDAPPSVAAGRGGDDGGGPPPPARDAQRDAPGGDATTPGRRRHTPRPHGPGSIADREVPSPFPLRMWMRRRTPHLMLLARRRPPSVQQALRPARARGRPQAKGSAPAARKHPAPQCRSAGPPDRNPHARPERSTLSGPRSLSIFCRKGFSSEPVSRWQPRSFRKEEPSARNPCLL